MWLSGLSAGRPVNQGVQFPVKAHAWVAGQGRAGWGGVRGPQWRSYGPPGWGHMGGNHTLMFLSLSFSLTSLSRNT